MNSLKNPLFRLLVSYLLWNAAGVLGGSLLFLYFKDSGVSPAELVFSFLFWAIAPILIISYFTGKKNLDMKNTLIAGVMVQTISYFALIFFPPSALLLYAFSFCMGLNCYLFWVPFNILYFELGKGKEASLSSLYFAINPLFGILFPVIGGVIAQFQGFGLVFFLALILYLILIPVAYLSIERRTFSYSLHSCLPDLKGFRTLIFIEGIYGGGIASSVAVISLFYFTKPSELGAFISATTLLSLVASFIISKVSDKSGKRKSFIALSGSALGLATTAAVLATTAIGWASAISLRNFVSALFYPFTTAIIMDKKLNLESTMVAREWLLNYGRVAGIIIVLFSSIVLSDIHLSLPLLGLVILFYPLIIAGKKSNLRIK